VRVGLGTRADPYDLLLLGSYSTLRQLRRELLQRGSERQRRARVFVTNPSAPADSNPKRETSNVCVDSFVICRRMSCLTGSYLPAVMEYH
jgi:hypothetical protein